MLKSQPKQFLNIFNKTLENNVYIYINMTAKTLKKERKETVQKMKPLKRTLQMCDRDAEV